MSCPFLNESGDEIAGECRLEFREDGTRLAQRDLKMACTCGAVGDVEIVGQYAMCVGEFKERTQSGRIVVDPFEQNGLAEELDRSLAHGGENFLDWRIDFARVVGVKNPADRQALVVKQAQ